MFISWEFRRRFDRGKEKQESKAVLVKLDLKRTQLGEVSNQGWKQKGTGPQARSIFELSMIHIPTKLLSKKFRLRHFCDVRQSLAHQPIGFRFHAFYGAFSSDKQITRGSGEKASVRAEKQAGFEIGVVYLTQEGNSIRTT